MKKLAILGSTGSIGTQTLEIVDENPERFSVVSLTANSNVDMMFEQVKKYRPELVCMYDESSALKLKDMIKESGLSVEVLTGMDGLISAAEISSADITVTAIVGMIGIRPTMAAIKAGHDIALANKETLVTAGHIIMPMAKEYGVKILPVDSEHSAIFQSLQAVTDADSILRSGNSQVDSILLTASGGPFRGMTRDELSTKTKADALKHPNWSMGAKITIDSSTLVNKGLEMMEAGWLFGVDRSRIKVLIHPQSILHSAVMLKDGAVIGQMGLPDMKLPILFALTYPERVYLSGERLDFYKLSHMDFYEPDIKTFSALKLAGDAMDAGGSLPVVFNAANEYLVSLFLKDEIGFNDITDYIAKAMDRHELIKSPDLEEILCVEKETVKTVKTMLSEAR